MSAYCVLRDVPTGGNITGNYLQYDTSSTDTVSGTVHNHTIVIVNTGPPESVCELPAKKYFVPPPPRKNPWGSQPKPPFCPRVSHRPEFHARSNPRSG